MLEPERNWLSYCVIFLLCCSQVARLGRESWWHSMGILSNRFAFFTWLCTTFTIGQGKLPFGGDKSALQYLLCEGGKDVCLQVSTLKGKAECLQALLENYYGEYFTVGCPSLPLILAERKCKGCAWDRVNASMGSPMIAAELKRSELLHAASASCSIANHVEQYNDPSYIRRNVFGYGIFGTSLLFLVTAYYSVSSSSGMEIENGRMMVGARLSEPVFLLTLWVLYHAGSFLLIISEDYVEFCGGESDKRFQEAARVTFYVILVMICLKRCRVLRVAGFNYDLQSWERYFPSAQHRKRKLCFSFFLSPFVVVLIF